MGRVGLLVGERPEAGPVVGPEAPRIAPEHLDVRDLHRIDALPQPGPRRAEVRNAARHGDAGAGERDRGARVPDHLRETLDAAVRGRHRSERLAGRLTRGLTRNLTRG